MTTQAKSLPTLLLALSFAGGCDFASHEMDAHQLEDPNADVEFDAKDQSASAEYRRSSKSRRPSSKRGHKGKGSSGSTKSKSKHRPKRCEFTRPDSARMTHVRLIPTQMVSLSYGDIRTETVSEDHDVIKVFAGESITMKLQNLGSGRFKNGIVEAFFDASSDILDPDFDYTYGVGWGTYLGSGLSESQYAGVMFQEVKAGKSVRFSPDVVQTCGSRFPYDAIIQRLSINFDALCRNNSPRDGRMRFTMVATNERGKRRIVRDFEFNGCFPDPDTLSNFDRTPFFPSYSSQTKRGIDRARRALDIGTPPQGPTAAYNVGAGQGAAYSY